MTAPATLTRFADWPDLPAAAAALGADPAVVRNWIVAGLKTESGRLRLAAVKVGGKWRVKPGAVEAFVAALTADALPAAAVPPTVADLADPAPEAVEPRPRVRRRDRPAEIDRRDHEASVAELRAMGIL